MDRCAILVDAGYLLGAAGTLVARDPDRSALEVDHAKLADALIHEAEVQTGLPVLRLLWYDGAFNSRPGPAHRTLRVLADVKVRLGELEVRAGGCSKRASTRTSSGISPPSPATTPSQTSSFSVATRT